MLGAGSPHPARLQSGSKDLAETPLHTADPPSSPTALPSRPPPPGNKPKMPSLKGLRGQVKARQSPPAPPAWLCPPAHPFLSPVWGWAALGHPIKPCQTVPCILTPPNIPPPCRGPAAPSPAAPALKTELFLSVLKRDVSQQPDFSPRLQHQLPDPVPVLSPPGAGEGRGGAVGTAGTLRSQARRHRLPTVPWHQCRLLRWPPCLGHPWRFYGVGFGAAKPGVNPYGGTEGAGKRGGGSKDGAPWDWWRGLEGTGGHWGRLEGTGGDWGRCPVWDPCWEMAAEHRGVGGVPRGYEQRLLRPPPSPALPLARQERTKRRTKKKKAAANPQPAPSALLRFTPCCRSPAGTTRRLFSPQNHPVSQLALPKSPSAAPKPPGFAPLPLARSPSGLVAAWGAGKGNGVGLHPKI